MGAVGCQPQARVGDFDPPVEFSQGGQVAKLHGQRGPSPTEWQAELWLPSGTSITRCLAENLQSGLADLQGGASHMTAYPPWQVLFCPS